MGKRKKAVYNQDGTFTPYGMDTVFAFMDKVDITPASIVALFKKFSRTPAEIPFVANMIEEDPEATACILAVAYLMLHRENLALKNVVAYKELEQFKITGRKN